VLADLTLAGSCTAVLNTRLGRLEIEPATRALTSHGYVPLRQARASLRLGRHLPLNLSVEVLPWSARMSEILFRTEAYRSPAGRLLTMRRYLRALHDAVGALSGAIEQWSTGLLGGLTEGRDELVSLRMNRARTT
jgi:hypothetical protein